MRILIAEDDFTSRKYLEKALSPYGKCDLAINGIEAIDHFLLALDHGNPFDLICLDIMMPKVDGVRVLKVIRETEKQKRVEKRKRVKIIIATALNATELIDDLGQDYDAYIVKPINIDTLINTIKGFGLLK
ncbi:MAG: response regulator [Clostridia bacterium]|nr:response regulator [Clostridia bacterium]